MDGCLNVLRQFVGFDLSLPPLWVTKVLTIWVPSQLNSSSSQQAPHQALEGQTLGMAGSNSLDFFQAENPCHIPLASQ